MSRSPMYEVIAQDLRAQIRSGALNPGDRLQSEPELSTHYGVSRMTVRQALEQLIKDGHIFRRHGVGTFVASQDVVYRRLDRVGGFHEEIGAGGVPISTKILIGRAVSAPDEIQERLGLKRRQKVTRLRRLQSIEERPVSIQESWVSYALAPGLAEAELVEGSLYRTLKERWGVRIQYTEQEISAARADEEQAALLDAEAGAPLVTIIRRAFGESDRPVEFARSWTHPEFPLFLRLDA